MGERPAAPDWGAGRYERTAGQLLPAAHVAIELAAVGEGERLVDVGCGTGNAALLAAERGALAIGVDPAPRLLEVARSRAQRRGLSATFEAGEADALPLADGSCDVVVSVFGVIFAPDERRAAAELARVCAPAGRVVLSAWLPEGAIAEVVRLGRVAIAQAAGAPPPPAGFAWHREQELQALLRPHGFSLALHERELPFTDASPQEFIDGELDEHPLWVSARPLLQAHGALDSLREQALAILHDANEDPAGFRVTSRYVVAVATRG
jgi:SAM-dependent methyltransferase